MDIVDLFIQKFLPTKNIKFQSVKELFQSDSNKLHLAHILYKEIYLPNNNNIFNNIKNDVNKYVDLWIKSGKLNSLEETNSYSINAPDEQLNYYNHLFITTFKNIIINYDLYNFEINNNPYKHILNYRINSNSDNKKYSDILPEDYDNLSFNNYNTKFTRSSQFTKKYHEIPYYEKALYKRNYDLLDMGSFREKKIINYNKKKYNNNELYNNISYLR